jgi:hypothetical protein
LLILFRFKTGAAHRFAESEVTIHYRSPIRNLQTPQQQDIDEEELRQRQAEHMRRVYEQERRRKYMVELEDLESRRHMDNFTYVTFARRIAVSNYNDQHSLQAASKIADPIKPIRRYLGRSSTCASQRSADA